MNMEVNMINDKQELRVTFSPEFKELILL